MPFSAGCAHLFHVWMLPDQLYDLVGWNHKTNADRYTVSTF
jgi:hypothetical protein